MANQGGADTRRRTEIVLRLLRGEDLAQISHETRVPAHQLRDWHRVFVEGGSRGLQALASLAAPEISVVIPVFNEAASLAILHEELAGALGPTGRSYEILFVDDGSTDTSFEVLRSLHAADDRVQVIRFRRNFGQTAALAAGFEHARGSVVISLDGDRQNDPTDIPAMLERLDQGFDMVCGWRKRRQDSFFSRRLPSRIANRMISFTTGVRLRDYGCTLKVMRSEVAKNLLLYGEMHRFIPAVASWMGVEIDEMVVSHHPRRVGKSKYGVTRTPRVLLDLLTIKFLLNYSSRPLQIFGTAGLMLGATGVGLGCYLTWVKYALDAPIANRPLLLLAVLLMVGGLQLGSLGLVGELITRLFHELRARPVYAIREVLSNARAGINSGSPASRETPRGGH